MSPKRGDRVTVPPPASEWDVRFGSNDVVKGWDELCRHALGNARRCLDALRTDPLSRGDVARRHRLRGALRTYRIKGRDFEQWEYEVTSGGRVRYVVDEEARTVWILYASHRRPKDTDR
ncbi:hypothetical protein [Herbidospora cretacea]|uniref:hypothetical protein n=1 Tax=Herbidospora cretacea TaxID=28444 RepID=UPI0004C4279E|nr:hypothetical protein [Herbidospora cretacea]